MARILAVDGCPTAITSVERALVNAGHTVYAAHDGLGAPNAHKYDGLQLALFDVQLPHVDGFQLCTVIRQTAKYASIPTIMLTGLSSRFAVQHDMSVGANAYLVKPINDARLLAAIEQRLVQAAPTTA
jgi:twitching motility two-component system response regulator PilH